jgi:hypothetical protein
MDREKGTPQDWQRQMDGRATFDLLRLRVLHAASPHIFLGHACGTLSHTFWTTAPPIFAHQDGMRSQRQKDQDSLAVFLDICRAFLYTLLYDPHCTFYMLLTNKKLGVNRSCPVSMYRRITVS